MLYPADAKPLVSDAPQKHRRQPFCEASLTRWNRLGGLSCLNRLRSAACAEKRRGTENAQDTDCVVVGSGGLAAGQDRHAIETLLCSQGNECVAGHHDGIS